VLNLSEAGVEVEAVIQELKSIGLGGYESQAYASLLKHGALTPMQVAKIAKIPGPRIYDVLRKLESMGFAVKEPRKREPRYSAVPIKAALERYGEELTTSHRDKEMRIKEVSTKLAKNIAPVVSTEEAVYLLDSDQIVNVMSRAIARQKVCAIGSTNWPIFHKVYPNVLKPIADLKKRGVELKFLVDVAKDNFRFYRKVAKYGEVKHLDEASSYGCYIVDGKEALLAPTPKTGPSDLGIWIKIPSMIKIFEDYFNLKFEEAIPLEEKIKELSKK
jgi:sugar-specific transcriptional regulator TrmB